MGAVLHANGLLFSAAVSPSNLIFTSSATKMRYSKFYPKKLSTNKSREKFYPEVLSTNFFIQNVPDLFDITLYH